jgi:ABC-type Na+ efflux pump permease subunit
MSKTNDIQERPVDLNSHPMAAAEDRETDEISRAAQNTLNDGQGVAETVQIDPESKARTLRLKGGAYARGQSLSTILLTLVAVLLAGLLFFLAHVVSFFSGSRKSGHRQRRR